MPMKSVTTAMDSLVSHTSQGYSKLTFIICGHWFHDMFVYIQCIRTGLSRYERQDIIVLLSPGSDVIYNEFAFSTSVIKGARLKRQEK